MAKRGQAVVEQFMKAKGTPRMFSRSKLSPIYEQIEALLAEGYGYTEAAELAEKLGVKVSRQGIQQYVKTRRRWQAELELLKGRMAVGETSEAAPAGRPAGKVQQPVEPISPAAEPVAVDKGKLSKPPEGSVNTGSVQELLDSVRSTADEEFELFSRRSKK